MNLIDIEKMPNFNSSTRSLGDHSISDGKVYWTDSNLVTCSDHRAMLAVNMDCTIWRCIACGAGAYMEK